MKERWTENQKKIHQGLKDIGGEASGFFESALTHYYDESLPNRVSQLAHAAREIDGGLRDILSPKILKDKAERTLIQKGIDKLFGTEFQDLKGHIASVLVALDVDEKNELAREWISVATTFHKYAHRHGIWKEARDFSEFKTLWEKYELILLKLVGSFYAIVHRIDRLINLEVITDAAAGALLNLLKSPYYSNYFFRHAKNVRWFEPLHKNGIFDPQTIIFDEKGYALFWPPLDFLEEVSKRVDGDLVSGKNLLNIIGSLIAYSSNVKQIKHYYIWWYSVKILNNLPIPVITQFLPLNNYEESGQKRYGFRTWLQAWTDSSQDDLVISDIGEHLLPKFLSDGSTTEYAELIFDMITRIKRGEKKSSFSGREDAELVWNTYWILHSFQKNRSSIATKCSAQTILNVADKLNLALEYKQKDHYVNFELLEDFYQLKASRIFSPGIGTNEIAFEENKYEFIVRKFSKEQLQKIDKNDFWALHNIQPEIEINRFNFTAKNKNEFESEVKKGLPSNINWNQAIDFDKKIGFLSPGLHEDHSTVWFKSLASGGSEHTSGAEEVLTIILRDLLIEKCKFDSLGGALLIKRLLSDDYKFPIFRRCALLCIDKYWDAYKELFSEFLETALPDTMDAHYEVELYDVLKNHNIEFDENIISKLKRLIANVPEYYVKENLVYYWQYKWLSPLKDHPQFLDLYIKSKDAVKPKDGTPYQPDRSSFHGGFVSHKSPLSQEEILKKPIDELVQYLNEFKGSENSWAAMEGEPDNEGLGNTLESASKDDPYKFINNIEKLSDVPYRYVHKILWGINQAIGQKKTINIEKILDFAITYIGTDREIFLKKALESQRGDSGEGLYLWVIDDIVGIIDNVSADDTKDFPLPLFAKAEKVFDLIFPLLKGEANPDIQNSVLTHVFNTTLGKTIDSFVSFSLRVARATNKKEDNWGNKKYERFFSIGADAYIYFGYFIPQMRFLDIDYTEIKIKEFSTLPYSDSNWQMFMEGYLSGHKFYKDVYFLMRSHYIKAIENKILHERMDERLVHHAVIGYLHGHELLQENNANGEKSLFWKMLSEAKDLQKLDRWQETVGFFWSITPRTIKKEEQAENQNVTNEEKERILNFWKWTYDNREYVKDQLGAEYTSLLARLSELTILLNRIDEINEKWILLSAPYVDRHHNSTFFLEYLTKFEDEESIKRIGRIFLKVLDGTTPRYQSENILTIIERLYRVGQKDAETKSIADSICNIYGQREVHMLKELWLKNQ